MRLNAPRPERCVRARAKESLQAILARAPYFSNPLRYPLRKKKARRVCKWSKSERCEKRVRARRSLPPPPQPSLSTSRPEQCELERWDRVGWKSKLNFSTERCLCAHTSTDTN
ncbi:hypothetical protein chiPu_0002292 [Chiloscyllium punctatum]|uniref:Uncharacterized protein n=1 Tax=Chiloscyllium punctatum TaxID=137246 RepID=A0A401S0G0_CHIPU|nr:hypothetical protein [Chiloscyllium punctatum]